MESYTVIRQLQLGLFGLVLLAKVAGDDDEEEVVCLKRVANHKVATREIDMLTRVGNHPGVCQLLHWFQDGDDMVLVLEYCVGDVYDLIHERDLTTDECVKLCAQIGLALQHCHRQGVYHRDLKPENVLYDQFGNFKLCDFGLATNELILEEMNVGSEKYMAPEMFDVAGGGSDDLGRYNAQLADYWGFGILMLVSIFGLAPFKPTTVEDTNFREFCRLPSILYDIYSNMNSSCFECFTNLVIIENPQHRDLTAFMSQFEVTLVYGFTMEEEDYDDDDDNDDILEPVGMFDVASRSLSTFSHRQPTSYDNTLPTLILLVKSTKLWCDMDALDDIEFHHQIDAIFHKLGTLHLREP